MVSKLIVSKITFLFDDKGTYKRVCTGRGVKFLATSRDSSYYVINHKYVQYGSYFMPLPKFQRASSS